MLIFLLLIVLTTFAGLSVKFYMEACSGRFKTNNDTGVPKSQTIKQWWATKRVKYNTGLVVSEFAAFITYNILGGLLIAPYDIDFELNLFTLIFQSVGYLLMMLLANLFYNLGALVDKNFNKDNSEAFRQRLFDLGFWFSVGLPFLIPALIVVEYFVRFAGQK